MMTEEHIRSVLRDIQYPEKDIPKLFSEMGYIISARALAKYAESMPEDKRKELASVDSSEKMETFLEKNAGYMPAFSQEVFNTVHDQTWQEFFDKARAKS